jgi:hypothetical protein
LRAVAVGAALGAVMSWGFLGTEGTRRRVHLLLEVFAVAMAVWALTGVLRDAPVVGEAPPEDPAMALGARLRGAAGKLAMAAIALLMAWDSIR